MKRKAQKAPWDIPDLSASEILALKSLQAGKASEGQQIIAYDVILNLIAGVDRLSFVGGVEDGRRATDFAEGRRWVGMVIREVCKMKAAVNTHGEPPVTT